MSTNVTLHAGHDVAYFTSGQQRGGFGLPQILPRRRGGSAAAASLAASADLGARSLQTFFRVILPTVSPGLVAGIGIRQVRIACGLILFCYLLSHFANHALGIAPPRNAATTASR